MSYRFKTSELWVIAVVRCSNLEKSGGRGGTPAPTTSIFTLTEHSFSLTAESKLQLNIVNINFV